jgi:ubiquinone/menaquinone biosynthesis C-methylase UbiE
MDWIVFAVLGAGGIALFLVVILTDGRYFGKGLMRWIYDRLGPSVFGTRSESERWQSLVETLQLRGDERILDVGTALGDLPLTIASVPGFGGEVVGIDWSPRMIARAQNEAKRRKLDGRARFEVVDVRKGLAFGDDEFDVVFCLGLLETLPRPNQMLGELKRVLRTDGAVVLSLYRKRAAKRVALSLAWYEKHLYALGLDDLAIVPCRRHHDVIIARHRPPPRG